MLTKLLVTILVISGAWAVLKRRASAATSRPTVDIRQSLIRKYMVTIILGVLLLGSALFLGWSWYDDNQLLSVTIVSPSDSSSSHYQVRKKDISADQIITVDGITIRLSSQERIIISTSVQQ